MKTVEDKYQEALRTPPPRGHRHPQLAGICAYAVMAGRSDGDAVAEIAGSWGYALGEHTEIADTLRRSRQKFAPKAEYLGKRQSDWRPNIKKMPQQADHFTGQDAESFVLEMIQTGKDAKEFSDLKNLSPINIPSERWEQTVTFIKTLYASDDHIFIGFKEQAKVASCVLTASAWIASLEKVVYGVHLGHPPQIGVNPLSGQAVPGKDGESTYRADNAVREGRYARIEFDDMPMVVQIQFWVGVVRSGKLPLQALTFSGKRSIHGLLQIDAKNRETWNTRTAKLASLLCNVDMPEELRADPNFRYPSHTMRIAGSLRRNLYEHEYGDGAEQPLLWLSAKPLKPTSPPPKPPSHTQCAPIPPALVSLQKEPTPASGREETALLAIPEKEANPYNGLVQYAQGRWRAKDQTDAEADMLLDAASELNQED